MEREKEKTILEKVRAILKECPLEKREAILIKLKEENEKYRLRRLK